MIMNLTRQVHDFRCKEERIPLRSFNTTSQRVNLFEKVKIPEAKENIRAINIFLGDQQTTGVARSKLAKGKALVRTTLEDGGVAA